MNILVISENFMQGGLETHINTLYETLNDKINFFFAFANYKDFGYLKNAKIYNKFCFSSNSTIEDFVSDVNGITNIIKENNINYIIVHPFYSFFPAAFAAHINNIKIAYTCHGSGSINFTQYANDNLLYNFLCNNVIDKVLCVSKKLLNGFSCKEKLEYFPNIVNEKKYKKSEIPFNGKWAMISRLNFDKKNEIIKIINNYNTLNIKYLDIYGDGYYKKEISNLIKSKKLGKKITLKGYCTNINTEIINKYDGIIGIGRVAEEAAIMGIPILISGYGKICGLVNREKYTHLSQNNFVNIWLEEQTIDKIGKEIKSLSSKNIKNYIFREDAIKDFGSEKSKKILNFFDSIQSNTISEVSLFLNELQKLDKDSKMYSDKNVFYLILNSFNRYAFDSEWYNIANIYKNIIYNMESNFNILNENNQLMKNNMINMEVNINSVNESNNKILTKLDNYKTEYEDVNNKIKNLYEKCTNIEKNMSLGRLIKNFIYNKLLKIKKFFKRN